MRVVCGVLEAAREELARIGYRGLRIEDVASLAGVNKTTIYRRWPTKSELVHDTLRTMLDAETPAPDTGSLRGDTLLIAQGALDFLASADGQVLVRMLISEGTEPDLRRILDVLRDEKRCGFRAVFERAAERGEIRSGVSVDLVLSTLFGCLLDRVFGHGAAPSSIDLDALVDLVLYGITPRTSQTT